MDKKFQYDIWSDAVNTEDIRSAYLHASSWSLIEIPDNDLEIVFQHEELLSTTYRANFIPTFKCSVQVSNDCFKDYSLSIRDKSGRKRTWCVWLLPLLWIVDGKCSNGSAKSVGKFGGDSF